MSRDYLADIKSTDNFKFLALHIIFFLAMMYSRKWQK